jgi:PAS domain S-box-containing protein
MINKILKYDIGKSFPFEKQKISLLLMFSIFMFNTLFFLGVYLFIRGSFTDGVIILLNAFVFLFPIYLARIKDFESAKSVFVTLYIITQTLQILLSGGFEPRNLIFLAVGVMLSFFLLGIRAGYISIISSLIIIFSFYGLIELGVVFPTLDEFESNKELSFLLALLFFLSKSSIIFIYNEKSHDDYHTLMRNGRERLNNAQVIGEMGSFWLDTKTGSLELSHGLLFMFSPSLVGISKNRELEKVKELIDKEDLKVVLCSFIKAFKKKAFEPISFRVRADGELKYFEAKGVFNEDKTILTGVVRDVTLTQAANKNVEDYKHALDQSALVSITDKSGVIVYANKLFQKVSKFTEEELLGKGHSVVNSGEHSSTFFRDMWKTISNGEIWRGTIKNQAKDGDFYWVDTTIIPFFSEGARPDYYMSIRFDVTNQAKISEEIVRKNYELEQFSFVLSHDLKSPLRAIKTLIYFVKEDIEEADLKLPQGVQDNIDLIDNRIVKMEALIMSVLNFAQAGNSQVKEWIDMNVVVNEVVELIDIPSNFKLNISKDLPQILMDKVELTQIVQNLLTNAIKYNKNENPEIIIYPGLKKREFVIHFKDNGIGIDPRFHSKVFNLFETLKQKDSYEATGIGLPIVRKVVEKAGGEVYIMSELGKGADFVLQFPFSVCKH